MSAVVDLQSPRVVAQPMVARWVAAWSQLNRHHALGLALAILLTTAIDISAMADKLGKPGVVSLVGFDLFTSVLLFSLSLLVWSAAVHGLAPRGEARTRALALAVVASSLLAATVIVPAYKAIGIPEIVWEVMGKRKEMPPMWLAIIGNTIHLGLFSFFFIAVAEIMQRRRSTHAAVLAAQREQASVAREVLESRLAAMQAQVEPQFLFNSLVAIEALYQKDAGAAAENLDRLIQYLRVALPRLREPGSTIGAEIDLVRAYLDVVTSLHGGRPALTVTVGHDCGAARFYPMLLLPLIQRAVRGHDGALPESIRIGVQKLGNDVVIVTRIAATGDCSEDFELARVRERLSGLYGERAALDCSEIDPDTTQFTLRVPASR